MLQNPHVLLTFGKVQNPLCLPRKTTSERPRVLQTLCFFHCWLRNVLRATTTCTFSTSQLPKVVRLVFCTFWLPNVLRATTACTFSTAQPPKVLRTLCVFSYFTGKRASRQNDCSSLIWPDGSAPAAVASLLLDPPEPQIIGKNTVNRDFSNFSRTCIFFLLTFFSSLIFSLLLFSSLTLPTYAFPSVHIVGSLTSKLPSIICMILIYDVYLYAICKLYFSWF